jgi:hypothetical protein
VQDVCSQAVVTPDTTVCCVPGQFAIYLAVIFRTCILTSDTTLVVALEHQHGSQEFGSLLLSRVWCMLTHFNET